MRHSYPECPTPNIDTIRSPALYKILLWLEKPDLRSKESCGERVRISEHPCVNHFREMAATVNTEHAFLFVE